MKIVVPVEGADRADHRDSVHELLRANIVIAVSAVARLIQRRAAVNRDALRRNRVALVRIGFVDHMLKSGHCLSHGLIAAADIRAVHIQFPRIAVIDRR